MNFPIWSGPPSANFRKATTFFYVACPTQQKQCLSKPEVNLSELIWVYLNIILHRTAVLVFLFWNVRAVLYNKEKECIQCTLTDVWKGINMKWRMISIWNRRGEETLAMNIPLYLRDIISSFLTCSMKPSQAKESTGSRHNALFAYLLWSPRFIGSH